METDAHSDREGSSVQEQLERSRRDLEDFFENGAVGLHWVASDGSILRVNQAELDLLGYSREEYVGRHIADFHADGPIIEDILARLTRGEKLDKYEARLKAKDGSIKHVLISSNVQFRQGRFINTRCFTLDVTDLKHAEKALRESEQRLRATHERAFAGIAEVDLEGQFLRANARFCDLTGYSTAELLERSFQDITHREEREDEANRFHALVAGEIDTYQIEKRFITKGGSVVWVELSASVVRDAQGRPLYGIRVAQDITELKRAEEKQKLLLEELNHRVKNMLATVQSVAMQTRRNVTDLEGYTKAFDGRLMTLNRAHELLTREIGIGVLLEDLCRQTIKPYELNGEEKLFFEGPPIRVGPEVAVTLAMALHELTTNAAKYGALSVPDGRIRVSCSVEQDPSTERDLMFLDWWEHGGPAVLAPTRRGFGTQLIERGLSGQLGGTASLQFEKGGLRCHIVSPLPQAGRSSA